MMHTRRLLGAVAGVAGAGVVSLSTWVYYPEEQPVAIKPRARKSRQFESNEETNKRNISSTRLYGLEQSPFRDLGDMLASATVSASQAYVHWITSNPSQSTSQRDTFHLFDNTTDFSSKDAKKVIDSSQFILMLNVISGDTKNNVSDASYRAINRLASNVECAAAIAERATRYGKKALLHLAKRHDMDPRLGDALRALTVLDGNECRFGPANLSSLVALVCTPDLPAPYAEFAWWALATCASSKALTSRYRWRKEWLGDDRVARTRTILMRNPHVWSAILATHREDSSEHIQIQAARLVKEMAASGLPLEDDEKLDLVLQWLSSDTIPLCAEALQILTRAANHEIVRGKLAARGVLDKLHSMIEQNEDTRLTALLLETVHALAFHHASSLDTHALASERGLTTFVNDSWLDGFDFDEPTYVRGWIDLFTSFIANEDADIAGHAVACLEALSTHGAYRNQGMQEWLVAVLDSVLQSVPLEVQRQASTVRAARSRTRPIKSGRQNSATEYAEAHTRALRALAFTIDRKDCQATFIRVGGLPLLRALLPQLPQTLTLQQEWTRIVANLLSNPHPDILKEFQRCSAWRMQLTQLASSSNMQVRTNASRALSNLEAATTATTSSQPVYMEGIHPLTSHSNESSIDVDVVFVHGLLGCAYETWIVGEDANRMWASEWLERDLRSKNVNPRIVTVGYDSKLFAAESSFATMCLDDTSRDLRTKLERAQIGGNGRPVIFVAHSMGGIVVKKILEGESAVSNLPDRTKGLVFYGVPHHGSPVAAAIFPITSAAERQGLQIQHPVTADLHGTPRLAHLNEWCANFMKKNNVRVLSVGESTPVKLPLVGVEALVVPETSSNPGFGDYVKLPSTDHIQVCKPTSIEDSRYTLTRDLILDAVASDRETLTH